MKCIVTGAASGIGAQLAAQLKKAGAYVAAVDRNPVSVEVDRYVPVDLADEASIIEAVKALDGEWDFVANVAGVPGTLSSDLVFAINFLGLRQFTERILPKVVQGGSVLNIASVAGMGWATRLPQITELLETGSFTEGLEWFQNNTPEGNAYTFSKEAVIVYTLRRGCTLLNETGVRMNAIMPGVVDTPILPDFEEQMGKEMLDGVREFLGKHADPSEIASAATFFARPESRWVNATTLIVDGGIAGAMFSGVVEPVDV